MVLWAQQQGRENEALRMGAEEDWGEGFMNPVPSRFIIK